MLELLIVIVFVILEAAKLDRDYPRKTICEEALILYRVYVRLNK